MILRAVVTIVAKATVQTSAFLRLEPGKETNAIKMKQNN